MLLGRALSGQEVLEQQASVCIVRGTAALVSMMCTVLVSQQHKWRNASTQSLW